MLRNIVIPLLMLTASEAFCAASRVEQTVPVASPNGARSVIIDHVMPVVGGETDEFSGQLVIRVVLPDGKPYRQRQVEASQVRIVNRPKWIDQQWCAFTYNISKNAQGVVFFNAEDGRALMVELVATARRMGATDDVVREITSLELAEYGESVSRYANIVRGNSSVFPLSIPEVPVVGAEAPDAAFLATVEKALAAYREFCTKSGVSDIILEQGSESFSHHEDAVASLACADAVPAIIVLPVTGDPDGIVLARLDDPSIQLSCSHQGNPNSGEDEAAPHDPAAQFRIVTSWKDSTTVLVERETYEGDDYTPVKTPRYSVTRDGRLEKLATADPTPAPPAAPAEPATP